MRYFEDFSVGDKAEFGQYEMTKEEIIEFASKYDPQPFHLSEEGGKASLFGGLCASGWHTCSATMRMMVDEMKEHETASLGSPGVDNVRWFKPVFPGDVLRVKTEVQETRKSKSRPQIGITKSLNKTLNQKDEVVMSFISNAIFIRREQD